jgi:4-hydroxy-2-oxoheptanedioate aldolase
MHRPNAFKAAIAARRRQTGLWLSMADSAAAEICASAGFDWFLIDAEHAPNDLTKILAQLRTLAAFDTEPVVRPPIGEAWIIKQLLDAGARSLLIPMVESPEQARELVSMTRYPPQGVRGVGARMARASLYGARADYIATAADEVCLLLQVESAAALDQIEAIAAVEGVNGIFVGPSDLAASMGHPGNLGHPDVRAAVDGALKRIAALGKPSGIVAFAAEDIRRYLDLDVMFIAVGADAAVLAAGTRALVAQYKQPL